MNLLEGYLEKSVRASPIIEKASSDLRPKGGVFICGNLPMRMKRSMNQRTMEVTTFAFIATFVMIAAVGLGLLIFNFSDSQDLLAQWLRSLTM